MEDSKKDNISGQDKDFDRLAAYANALEKKYQQPIAHEQEIEPFLASQSATEESEAAFFDETAANSNKINEQESNEYAVENDVESHSALVRFGKFIGQRKYLLVLIPVFFLILFLLTSDRTHTGSIKTDGFTYSGQVLNDVPNGKGTMTYANGDTYSGNFENGKFSGAGTFKAQSANWSFSGNFKDGLADGKGVMTTPDGAKHEEIYKNGVLAR